ncbi:hypothetical protein QQP08_025549 [Theobroma cacao]|nr:hypothetical protein QQP08_025549 [Theobroma cacao]
MKTLSELFSRHLCSHLVEYWPSCCELMKEGFELVSGEYGSEDVAVVCLHEDDQGLAAGQFAAFYEGQTCIGSGVILESWDDQGFPVCAKALEIARMEDKSKLGKPVKIKAKAEVPPEISVHNDCIELNRSLISF